MKLIPQNNSAIIGILKSFGYAFEGILYSIKTQRNVFIHLIATICILIVSALLKISAEDWRWIIVCITLVWVSELLNTAFEYLCDLVMPEIHNSVKRAKDIAAGAVLICAISAVLIGVVTLIPYINNFDH